MSALTPYDPSTHTDAELLERANEISELLQRAVKLGYSLSLGPEQMKTLIYICEEIRFIK